MFVADHNGVTLSHRGRNHGVTLQKSGDLHREISIPVSALSNPCGSVGRNPEAHMVRRCNVGNDTVESANLDPSPNTSSAIREHGTGGRSVGQDQEPVVPTCSSDFPRIVSAL